MCGVLARYKCRDTGITGGKLWNRVHILVHTQPRMSNMYRTFIWNAGLQNLGLADLANFN